MNTKQDVAEWIESVDECHTQADDIRDEIEAAWRIVYGCDLADEDEYMQRDAWSHLCAFSEFHSRPSVDEGGDSVKPITQAEVASKLGCNRSAVARAASRLGIDPAGLTTSDLRTLRKEITPGGRGHWKRGKRRNPDRGKWGQLRLRLARFLQYNYRRGEITPRALSIDIGASDRSVHRWISGEDRPAPAFQDAIEQWIVEHSVKKR